MKAFFAQFPPLCQKRLVDTREYGLFTQKIMTDYNLKPGMQPKLISDVLPKDNFPIHYCNLKQVLSFGVELVKIHRAVR